ncbi:TIGR04076 family protein [Chloroflexota bacterium]
MAEVTARVISQQGTCAAGHKDGDTFVFGSLTPTGMCDGAYHTLYPFAWVLRFGGSFPWGKDKDRATIACPDAENPVVFELERR